jgi:HlyD family secretion protein
MKVSLSPSQPAPSQQAKRHFVNPEESLSYELGKAVQELPPFYTRFLAGTISFLVLGTIGWAHFSLVDEVAIARGELIPSTEVRPLRSLSRGTITNVAKAEGETVRKGDVLLTIDPISTNPKSQEEEVQRLTKSVQLIRQDLARLEAERSGLVATGTAVQDQLLSSRLREFDAKQSSANAEANKQIASRSEAEVRLTRLQENLINAKTNLTNAKENYQRSVEKKVGLETLQASGAVPRVDYLNAQIEVTNSKDRVTEAEDKIVSIEKELAGQQQRIQQADQAFQSAQYQSSGLGSQRTTEILTQLNKRREELTTVEGQLAEAIKQKEKGKEQEVIKAPFDGTIYSLKATKGTVQEGEELLSITPSDEDLPLQVKVLNRDIGFIKPGMAVKVKLDTFPFQEFGIVEGEVMQVSANAIPEKDVGLVFLTRVKLNKHQLPVRGKTVKFTPGMSAAAEIVTRQKSILTFITEPVTRRFSEAFSVR